MKLGDLSKQLVAGVQVRLWDGNIEAQRYMNSNIPESLMGLPIKSFDIDFDILGKPFFKIYFKRGVLSKEIAAM